MLKMCFSKPATTKPSAPISVSLHIYNKYTGSGALRTAKTKKFDIKSSFDRMKKHCPDLKRSRSTESRKIEKKIIMFLQHFQKYIYQFSESENNLFGQNFKDNLLSPLVYAF